MKNFIFALVFLAFLPAVSFAQPFNMTKATAGFLYFNSAGADMARHDGELKNCIEHWAAGISLLSSNTATGSETAAIFRNVPPRSTNEIVGGAIGGVVADIVTDFIMDGWDRARRDINIEHCMVAKGWRLVRLLPEEGERLSKLSQKDLAAALTLYVSAEQPQGEIVRTWRNEGIYQSTITAKDPQAAKRKLLSVAAISPDSPVIKGITSIDPAARLQAQQVLNKQYINGIRTTKLTESPTVVRPNQSLLMFSIRSKSKKRHISTFLELSDPTGPMSRHFFGVIAEKEFQTLSDGTFITHGSVVVPSGTWFVQGARHNMDYCLGAPYFEAKDGASVYLGTFDATGDKLTVNTDKAAIEQKLGGRIANLETAQWKNGFTYPCSQMSMYALEFDGFPFAEGYLWGSQAQHVK